MNNDFQYLNDLFYDIFSSNKINKGGKQLKGRPLTLKADKKGKIYLSSVELSYKSKIDELSKRIKISIYLSIKKKQSQEIASVLAKAKIENDINVILEVEFTDVTTEVIDLSKVINSNGLITHVLITLDKSGIIMSSHKTISNTSDNILPFETDISGVLARNILDYTIQDLNVLEAALRS